MFGLQPAHSPSSLRASPPTAAGPPQRAPLPRSPGASAPQPHGSQLLTSAAPYRASGAFGQSSGAGPSGHCLIREGQAGPAQHCGRQLAAAAVAAVLLLLAPPGSLVASADARIPTETFLSDGGSSGGGGGAAASSGRSALLQLAVPPSAVVAPAEAELEPGVRAGAGPGSSSGASRWPGSGAWRGVAPGTMVGTPNYARGPVAGPGLRSTASEAAEALQLLSSAREAVDVGQHDMALELYGRLVSEHPDLALAEYGRIGRAMMLYQVGRTSDSILALEDEEVAMRGAAEVHAALAALLYSERPSLALRAEEEWNMACLFDKRYSDTEWVRTNKHWPPRMIAALQKFLSLS